MLQQAIIRLGRVFLLGVGCLFFTSQASALTLGDLVVHSSPGEPLRASIPLTLQGEEQLAQLHVTVAPADVYELQHLERPSFLDGMRIGLLTRGEANARIQLFGEQPWQGEDAVLLLQAVWPQGKLSQRFRLIGIKPDEKMVGQTPLFVEVAENETLDTIAIRLSAGRNRSYLHMMYALFQANPDAFYRGNMNNLKGGARLRVPTEEELYQLSDAEVFSGIRQQSEQWQKQQVQSPRTETAGLADPGLKGGPQAQQQQMQQLAEENDAIQRRNEELKARLARLEKQMQQVTKQVLEYPPAEEGTHASGGLPPETAMAAGDNEGSKARGEGLPAYVMLIAMLLALSAGVLVWRYAATRRGGGH